MIPLVPSAGQINGVGFVAVWLVWVAGGVWLATGRGPERLRRCWWPEAPALTDRRQRRERILLSFGSFAVSGLIIASIAAIGAVGIRHL